ncbi:MAG: dihydrodipicolinate synthase family protein [Acidobacteriota bacterium]|nr:dihydrodipicolinate synthase family protein [Acidobacteriota bacterium]
MNWRDRLRRGVVIPAHPLALTAERKLDERHQRALSRYYLAAGAGGIAVGVHTTQFAIRDPKIGLFQPVLELAMEETRGADIAKIAGICGELDQASREAAFAAQRGCDCGLVSLAALGDAPVSKLVEHVRTISEIVPVFGFYLQSAVGGRILPIEFWRQVATIENVVAIKIAPFNRYQTLDVLRAVEESGRAADIALYTGNDDNILFDLLTPNIVGGLLGQWSVWTLRAAELLEQVHEIAQSGSAIPFEMMTLARQITDSNAALFDPAHGFRGCIAGLHEILRRQGLMTGRWCLDPDEDLSPGQMEEIDRVCRCYPHLTDDEFVRENLDRWLK